MDHVEIEKKEKRNREYDELFRHHLKKACSPSDSTEEFFPDALPEPLDQIYQEAPEDTMVVAEVDHEKGSNEAENISSKETWNRKDPEVEVQQNQMMFKYRLAGVVSKHKLTIEVTRDLLEILRDEGLDVPKSRTTFLENPRNQLISKKVAPGEYAHFGIQTALFNLAF